MLFRKELEWCARGISFWFSAGRLYSGQPGDDTAIPMLHQTTLHQTRDNNYSTNSFVVCSVRCFHTMPMFRNWKFAAITMLLTWAVTERKRSSIAPRFLIEPSIIALWYQQQWESEYQSISVSALFQREWSQNNFWLPTTCVFGRDNISTLYRWSLT